MLRILHGTHFDFIRYWRIAASVTAVFIAVGIASFVLTGSVRYSIEFTGGTLMQLEFDEAPSVADLRSTLAGAGVDGAEIQTFGSSREFTVRARESEQVAEQAASGAESVSRRIEQALQARYGADAVTVVRTEAVGPRVGDELRRNAIIAVILSFGVTLAYLAFRFEWRFGVAAVLATAHDLVATLAFVKLMDIEVSLTVVAGLLTVIGYSLNDTIIIFDRVRENLHKKRKESLYDTVNRSINETVPRAVMTHGTTLAATVALLVFAGPVIRPFAWVMTFGIFTGTFSSIYVAGPLLLWIERKWPRQVGDTKGIVSASAARSEARRQRPA
ncbi:MAG: protein translocase subunit SecF [Gemmatimonadaceae bacterium]